MNWLNLLRIWGSRYEALLRKNVEPFEALGLAEDRFTDDQLIDFMLQHPILINRPIVVTPLGTRLCRPSEWCWIFFRMHRNTRSPKKMVKKSLMMQVND
jgi:arsenate reductase-like glutaredoxin family protein